MKKYSIASNEWEEIANKIHNIFLIYHTPKIRVKQHISDI